MTEPKYPNRESWLIAAVDKFTATFKKAGAEIPPIQVACGWPSERALSKKHVTLGTCWDRTCSSDGKAQLFISPRIDNELHFTNPPKWDSENPSIEGDCMGVLPTLAHEIVHAVLGNEAGHGKEFGKLARGIGLEGKLTSTHAGEALAKECADIARILGPYPHGRIDPSSKKTGKKKQGTRMLKCECADCGYTVRLAKKWADVGLPSCPQGHGTLALEEKDGDEGDGEDGE